MKKNPLRHGSLPLAALLLLGLAAATAPAAPAAQPADLTGATVYPDGVDFRPSATFFRATVTVSGQGRVFRQSFDAGDRLSIGLLDPDGQPLADGAYTWQLDLVPDETTASELRRAASRGDDASAEAWRGLIGSFAVRGGQIADPAVTESRPEPATAGTDSSPIFPSSGLATDRGAAQDDDAAVGSRTGVEARVNAAAQSYLPAPAGGALTQPDPVAGDDADATTTALGHTLEPTTALVHQPSARPRSDGSNGRPRS